MPSMLQKIIKHSNISLKLFSRKFHFNTVCYINRKWREEKKLPMNPNSFGPLTNLPDYSFIDNRPVPYGTNQKRRIDIQREYLLRIKKLVGEIDYAVEKYELSQKQVEENKRKILESKLKEKGSKLLTKMIENTKS